MEQTLSLNWENERFLESGKTYESGIWPTSWRWIRGERRRVRKNEIRNMQTRSGAHFPLCREKSGGIISKQDVASEIWNSFRLWIHVLHENLYNCLNSCFINIVNVLYTWKVGFNFLMFMMQFSNLRMSFLAFPSFTAFLIHPQSINFGYTESSKCIITY